MERELELVERVLLPRRRWHDIRAASGPWIDYLCATYPDWARASDPGLSTGGWPAGFEPEHAPVYARNQLRIEASPEAAFAELCAAERWPRYYENASRVSLPPGTQRLAAGTRFAFHTFGNVFRAHVTEFEPARRLAWTCHGSFPRVSAHHRWLLEPAQGGVVVTTEETDHISTLAWLGPVNRLFNALLARSGVNLALPAAHELWLRRLKERLESRKND